MKQMSLGFHCKGASPAAPGGNARVFALALIQCQIPVAITWSDGRLRFRPVAVFHTFRSLIPMSQHPSLKSGGGAVGAKRSVLKRFERVKLLKKRAQWKEGQSALNLPKTTPDI